MRALRFAAILLVLGTGLACSSSKLDPLGGDGPGDTDGTGDGDGDGTDGNGDGTDNGPGTDTGTTNPNGSTTEAPFPKEAACEVLTSEATLGVKPVDIILVIDNSGSMTEENVAVENNVNVNFAQILDQSGLDYRLILISRHGSASQSQSICISAPLSGNTNCNPPPAAPSSGARFFQYDIEIGSTNGLSLLLSTYSTTNQTTNQSNVAPGGWKSLLRPDSVKTLIAITDDESSMDADTFEAGLFALQPAGTFGDATQRNYTFHSIIGITANSPVTSAWQPTDPKKSQMCNTAAAPGARYEDLSIRTGGLRFPVCETGSYDAVFQAAAATVIAGAEARCDFMPPAPPQGELYGSGYVEYTPGNGGAAEFFTEAQSADACSEGRFLRDPATHRITLCDAACTRVKADSAAKLAVVYACGGGGIQ